MTRKESKEIKYFKGIKYVLAEDVWFETPLLGFEGQTRFVRLYKDGWLHIKAGWGWDGASGPTIDTKTSLRGSLAHDGGALCMRQEFIPRAMWDLNDRMLERINLEDGMCSFRAKLWTRMLAKIKGAYGHPDKKRRVYTAP